MMGCICMYVDVQMSFLCVYVCVCVCSCVHVCMHASDQPWVSLLRSHLPCLFKEEFSSLKDPGKLPASREDLGPAIRAWDQTWICELRLELSSRVTVSDAIGLWL